MFGLKLTALSLLAASLISVVSATPFPLSKRVGSTPSLDGAASVIDPEGEYIRVTRNLQNNFIAGYCAIEGNKHILRTALSTDGGNSWTYLGEVFRMDQADGDIDNAFPLQLPSGRILYAYRNHDRVNYQNTFYRISISYSDDGGVTFKYLATVDQRSKDPNGVNGLWEPFLRIAQDGSLQCYYSSENAANDQDTLMRTSTDGGQTWSDAITATGAGVTSRDGMVGVAPIDNNGNLIAVFENTEDPTGFNVRSVTSNDDGKTWNNDRRIVYKPSSTGKVAGAPQTYNVWGTLVVSFMTNEIHDVGTGYDGGDMMIVISTDGANTWGAPFITGPSPAHWPGIFNRDETHLMAMFSQDGRGALNQLVALS